MKNFIKNIFLLVVVLLLSYYTAPYFGSWYDKFSPQNSSSFLGIGKEISLFIVGLPFAYVFFTIFLFGVLSFGSKKKWIGILLIPPILFWLVLDSYHIYLPIILGIIAFVLAKLINLVISKFKRPNLPMVVK